MSIAEHDRIPEIALEWIESGRRAAIATVVETWGSAPRPAGSQLVISEDAEMMGSVFSCMALNWVHAADYPTEERARAFARLLADAMAARPQSPAPAGSRRRSSGDER